MLIRFILLFTLIPLIELAILIKLGQYVGIGYTILIVLLTGILGAYLAKTQGMDVLRRIQTELETGNIPGNQIIEGLCILVGGAMLLTPGLITDLCGFVLVIPLTRVVVREWLKVKFRNMIERGQVNFYWNRWQ
ncbi:MAG: hypothetical protein HPY66_1915 [Firmicutes bacterium]|nr:hypothetical protein [Bacillota bacterium]MDI6704843.1 membrane protein FxsA [Bacillota bacterium]